METHTQKTPMRDVALRAIAVLGLIAVLLLGAWGIIQLAVAIPSLFSNISGGTSPAITSSQKETLAVSAAASIASGQTLQVSWNHQNKSGQYSYALSYACQSGLSLKAPLPTGGYQSVPCNTPFNYTNATDHLVVIPTATGATTPLAITISATKLSTGAVTAQGTATASVSPAATSPAAPAVKTPAAKAPVTKNPGSSTYIPAATQHAFYGYGDLAVRINSIAPSQSGLTSVSFTIQNVGTNVVPAGWTFNATLPINGSYMFMSQPQRALNPGDKIVYTLTFSGGSSGYGGGYNGGYPYGYTGAGYYTGAGSYSGLGTYTCTGYSVCFRPSQDPIDYTYGNTAYNYNYGYNYGYSNGPVTITADPQNVVLESNESNNTATAY